MAWKTGNMLHPAIRGITGMRVSIASWKLPLCVGTGVRNPDSPFKPVSISGGGTSCSTWNRELGSCGCVALHRHCSGMLRHAGSCSSPCSSQDLWVRAGKRMGSASGLSHGQPEGLSFPQ